MTALLLNDPARVVPFSTLPTHLREGDVVVVNDAATFPGSVPFTWGGRQLEARLFEKTPDGFRAVLFGEGDFRQRTEHRPPPPALEAGTSLVVAGLVARVTAVDTRSARLVDLRFDASEAELWAAVYRHGRPIQYSHQPEPLPLWAVQNAWAERPWAAELPSAGHHFTVGLLQQLAARGVAVARLTHATGLSATGDAQLDAALPFPERFSIPAETIVKVRAARRVIAVGTSVLRALEASGAAGFQVSDGVATEPIEPETELRVVDALVTGIHSPHESHYRLLGALLSPEELEALTALAQRAQLRPHEFGDVALLSRGRRARALRSPSPSRAVTCRA